MNTAAEPFIAAQKAQIETLWGLGQCGFQNVEKLVELSLQASRSAMADAADTARAALSVKSPQDFVALQQSLMQPAAEKAVAYGRQVYEIAASGHAELVRVAETQWADAQQKFVAVVDTAVKNAPAGSENVVALVKSAVNAAQSAVEQAQKTAKQAAAVAESNLQALAKTAESAAKAAPSRSKRSA